nr:BT4734/BF3469 family protein [Bacteroides intestinalis]
MTEIKISLFKGYSDMQPTENTLQEVVNLIKNDALVRDRTEKHRYYTAQKQKAAAAQEKSSCPCFAVAVRFEGGKRKENICGWTRLGLADIDHVPDDRLQELLKRIRKDTHTLLAYTTISGTGIRILFLTDCITEDHEKNLKLYPRAFEQTNNHYARLLDCECDMKCKNVTRLSGLAHDPDVFFNPEAQPFHIELKNSKKENAISARKSGRNKHLEKAVKASIQELEAEGICYEEHHHNEYIMRMGYLLNSYGIAQKIATEWALTRFADYDGDIAGIFSSCYQNTGEHGTRPLCNSPKTTSGNENFASVEEIETFLGTQALFRHNVITGKCKAAKPGSHHTSEYAEMDDRFVNSLWSRMCKEVKPVRINDIRNILASEYVPLYNPFTEYFKSLHPWDGVTDYIGELATTVHVRGDQATFTEYFRKWLIGTVVSLLDEHVVNHEILILIGPQGCFKTTWFNKLLPPALQRYFYTKTDNNRITKDDKFTLTEFALLCMEEIDELNTSALNQIKAMTTTPVVNERMAYAHYKERRPHIASLCGTTNNEQFLTDPSGSRRWLPFNVVSIDDPYTHTPNYEGVYAQAYALWKSGFRYWFNEKEVKAVNQRNTHFEVPNLEKELILTHYRRPIPGEECIFVTTAHILNRISGSIKQPLSPTKIGIIMKQAGFELIRSAGQRGYRVVELKTDEIYRNQCAIAHYTEGIP